MSTRVPVVEGDDTDNGQLQLYINCPAGDAVVTIRQLTCMADVDAWMKPNRLCLNPQKTIYLDGLSEAASEGQYGGQWVEVCKSVMPDNCVRH